MADPKKIPSALCDFLEGSRQSLNFASDTLIDSGVGLSIAAAATTLPQASIPAILATSTIGQTMFGNLFSELTQPAKTMIHGLTEKIVPNSCKNNPLPTPSVDPSTPPLASTTNILHQTNNITINKTAITNILVNLGITESQLQMLFEKHTDTLVNIENKLDKVIAWQDKQDQAKTQQQHLENFQNVQALCGALGALGNAIGCKELTQGAATLGAALQIGLGVATCFANPVIGAVMIVGGIVNLIGLFSDSGPNPHQIILEQIGKLSEQIANMHEDMLKLFNQTFKMQKVLLDVMQQGFSALSNLIKGEVGSFRINMQAALERMEIMQRDLSKQIQQGQQQLYLKDFTYLQTHIDDFLAGRYSSENFSHQVLTLANEVTLWSSKHSCSPLLNGADWRQMESITTDTNTLNRLLAENPEITANSAIGFFFPEIAQPVFWLSTANLYTRFTQRFWNVDFDQKQQDIIKDKGNAIIEICDKLNKDAKTWEKPLSDYYQTLGNIQKTMQDFAKRRYHLWLQNRNETYAASEKAKYNAQASHKNQTTITAEVFNFLDDDIDSFIATFNNRTPNQIQLQTHDNIAIFSHKNTNQLIINKLLSLGSLTDLNPKRIYQTLNLNPEVLCAEFMGLIKEISVKQIGTISGINKQLINLPFFEEKLVLTESTAHYSADTSWKIFFDIVIKFPDGSESLAKQIDFHKTWKTMPDIIKFWDDNKSLVDYDSSEGKKYLKNHINLIQASFNTDESITYEVSNEQDLTTSARQKIAQEIIRLRRIISEELLTMQVTDDAQSQALLEQLKKQFILLDFHARKLKHLLYFAGKDLQAIDDKILTTNNIVQSLQDFIEQTSSDTSDLSKPCWLTRIENALHDDHQLTAQKIIALTGNIYPEGHPKNIANRGLLLLNFNSLIRNSYRQQFPLYAHYLSLEKYQTEQSRRYVEAALREIYNLVKANFATRYKKAKFRISDENIISITQTDYKKFYYAFFEWCNATAKETLFIGENNIADWQTTVRLKLERGWESNIALLYQFAKPNNNKTIKLSNYLMWRDGIHGLLKMMTYPMLEKSANGLLANPADNPTADQIQTHKIQITHLEQIYAQGAALYQAMEDIVQTTKIDETFANHLSTLDQLIGVARLEQNNQASDQVIFDALTEKQFAGSTIKLLDSLDAEQIFLKCYCEMLLGYFPWQTQFTKLKNKQQLLDYLQPDEASETTLLEKLQSYRDDVIETKNLILNLFDQIRELIILRDALNFLKTYKNNAIASIEGSTLVLNASSFKFTFDDLKINLLNAFLGQAKGIQSISFREEDFSHDLPLKNALRFVKNHPEMHSLTLSDSSLTTRILEDCSDEFSSLTQIHKLNLDQEHLISDDIFTAAFDQARIQELFERMPQLSTHEPMEDMKQNVDLSQVNLQRMVCLGPVSLEADLCALKNIQTHLTQKCRALENPEKLTLVAPNIMFFKSKPSKETLSDLTDTNALQHTFR